MLPVDYLSAAIVELSLRPASINQTFHFGNPTPIARGTLAAHLRDAGYEFDDVGPREWCAQIAADESNPLRGLTEVFATVIERDMLDLTLDASATERVLAGSGLACPEIDADLFGTYVDYFVRIGYLPVPDAAYVAPDRSVA
jgi:hypothetical protein